MKQKEVAIKILLKKGSFDDIQAMSQYDVRIVFILAEILVTAAKEKLYLSAAIALGSIGPEGLPFLIHTIGSHTNPAVRGAAILGIAKSNAPSAIPTLIDALQDPKSSIRQKAARTLGQIGDSRAVNALIELMLNDKKHAPRESAITALGKIGSARALAPLNQIIQKKEDKTLVACAQQVLQIIEERSGVKLPK